MANKNSKFNNKNNKNKHARETRNDVNTKSYGKMGKFSSEDCKVENVVTNHPEYYTKYPELVEQAGKVSFAQLSGLPFKAVGDYVGYGTDNSSFANKFFVDSKGAYTPGIVKINYVPTYGFSENETSAINVASQLEYSIVRHMNSGSRNYEDPDLTELNIAIDSAMTTIAVIHRALSIINAYSAWNRYWPHALLESMGLDLDDLVNNRYMYLAKLNSAIAKLNSIAIPGNIDIIKRHYGLAKNVFIDDTNMKGQVIYYMPKCYYVYDWDAEGGGAMRCKYFLSGINGLFRALEEQLDNIFNNEDIGIMSGDIMKAFGDSVVKVPYVTAEEVITLAHDEYVLWQIHNAITLPKDITFLPSAFDITQTGGYLICKPTFSYTYSATQTTRYDDTANVIDLPPSRTSPVDIMYSTRHMPLWHYVLDDSTVQLTSFGSEVITEILVYGFGRADDTDGQLVQVQIKTDNVLNGLDASGYSSLIAGAMAVTEMGWAPRMNMYVMTDGAPFYVGNIWSTQNVAIMDSVNLAQLHDVAMLSLWKV